MSSPTDSTPATPRGRHSRVRSGVHVFFVAAITIAGCMFFYKLFSFLKTNKKDELAGFAFDPIIVYALVATGFLFLLAWAYLSGQFRDIESPKWDMLERFDEQEGAEARMEELR